MAAKRREADGWVTLFDDAVLKEIKDALAGKGLKPRDVEQAIRRLCTTLIDAQWAEAIWLAERRATAALRAKKNAAKGAIGRARGLLLGDGGFLDPGFVKKKYPRIFESQRRRTSVLSPIEFDVVDRVLKTAEARWDARFAAQERKLREKKANKRKPEDDGVDILVEAGLPPGRAAAYVAKLCGDDALCKLRERLKAEQQLVTYEIKQRETTSGYSRIARNTLSPAQIDAALTQPLSDREAELRDDARRKLIPLERLHDLGKSLAAEICMLDRTRINVASVTTKAYSRKRERESKPKS